MYVSSTIIYLFKIKIIMALQKHLMPNGQNKQYNRKQDQNKKEQNT